jgi:hypothetical protein
MQPATLCVNIVENVHTCPTYGMAGMAGMASTNHARQAPLHALHSLFACCSFGVRCTAVVALGTGSTAKAWKIEFRMFTKLAQACVVATLHQSTAFGHPHGFSLSPSHATAPFILIYDTYPRIQRPSQTTCCCVVRVDVIGLFSIPQSIRIASYQPPLPILFRPLFLIINFRLVSLT